ncbi:Probable carboxypeptidase S-like 2, partial [Durusdinium trenchii]
EQEEGKGGAMEVPSPHSCWVCASREAGFVREPGLGSKAREAGKDVVNVENLSGLIRRVSRIVQATGASMCVLAVLVLGLSFADARLGNGGQPSASEGDAAPLVWIGAGLGAGFVVLLAVVVFNAATLTAESPGGNEAVGHLAKSEETPTVDSTKAAEIAAALADAIRCKTISHDVVGEGKYDTAELLKLHELLRERFPLVHSSTFVTRTVVNDLSLLYEWQGSDPNAQPVMLCAHLDVVPTPHADEWAVDDPFGGLVDDEGIVWGRGAIDNKHNVLTQLFALESLLEEGVTQLERTVFFAFGHDEEIGGYEGAQEISKVVQERLGHHSSLALVLDEGPFVVKGAIPGVDPELPIAFVANVEKGNCSIKLTVDSQDSGHSSMPHPESNIGILAKALHRLETRPFPPHLDQYLESVRHLGSHLPLHLRLVFGNAWLFKPLLRHLILSKPTTAAGVRTTTAITVAKAGNKINVMPGSAMAFVNHRIHPEDIDEEHVMAYDRKVINDRRVKMDLHRILIRPSPVTPIDTPQFALLERAIKSVFHGPVVPTIMVGNTDTRHYLELAKDQDGQTHVFRFSPVLFDKLSDTKMFHGIDERISTEKLSKCFLFYRSFLCNVDDFLENSR